MRSLFLFMLLLRGVCASPQLAKIGPTITTREADDLRALFTDSEKIEAWISRKVCAVWGPRRFPHGPQEVHVGEGTDIDEVLRYLVTTGNWKPQIRVISRDSILQTPLSSNSAAKRDKSNAIIVHAGDLVFIQATE